jgi:hypothetical protein
MTDKIEDAKYANWLEERDAILEAHYHSLPTPRPPWSAWYKKYFPFIRTATMEELAAAGWVKPTTARAATAASPVATTAKRDPQTKAASGKVCAYHKTSHSYSDFGLNSSHKDGYNSSCREAVRARRAQGTSQ